MNIQQIRAQIAALQDATMDENKNFRTAYDEGKFDALTAVDALLDSLQEEPECIWHNMDEVPIKGEVIVVQTKDTFYGLSVQKGGTTYKNKNKDRYIKWAYASDLLNLSNVERIGKEWKEEPVSRTPADIEAAMQEVEEKSKAFTEAYQGESFDEILAWMRGEEPVSKVLEEAAWTYYDKNKPLISHELDLHKEMISFFIAGAQWQKVNLWKPADGDDLPEIDREVIVLYQPYPCEGNEYAVSFAHRPNPDGWDGKSITTGEIEHYTPKTYDKGGWNIPDVKFWLDCELPKTMEE